MTMTGREPHMGRCPGDIDIEILLRAESQGRRGSSGALALEDAGAASSSGRPALQAPAEESQENSQEQALQVALPAIQEF